MSWEYLCEICGKSIFSSEDWRGCQTLCEECKTRNADADHMDALLFREKMGLLSKVDEAQLENYKLVYPDYFTDKHKEALALDRAIEADMDHARHQL